jgi:hypothetical protein
MSTPALRPTLASCAKFASWLAAANGAGALTSARSKELTGALRAMVAILRQRHSEGELEQMRRLVVRAERAAERRLANEREDRVLQDDAELCLERRAVGEPAALHHAEPEEWARETPAPKEDA